MTQLVSTSDALVTLADHILDSIDDLHQVQYKKKGRTYRFVNHTFQRVRQQDKHLIIDPDNLDEDIGLLSAFSILYNINNGEILTQFPDFCCTILSMARQLERNKWFEDENSCVVNIRYSSYDPRDLKDLAEEYIEMHPITENHIKYGVNLMYAAKLNFLHTDHHIGTKLEGLYMRQFIEEYYGEQALNSSDVLIALKSCVHWGNIKGMLYKLGVADIDMTPELIESFDSFPDADEKLRLNVYQRYPSGTSKYSLIRKSLDILSEWRYSRLVPLPHDLDLSWIYQLCHDIETNPIRYHLRSHTKRLCIDPVNLGDLNTKYSAKIKQLLNIVSIIINVFQETGAEFLLQNSKFNNFGPELINSQKQYYEKLLKLKDHIEVYEDKQWNSDDIVIRLDSGDSNNSLYHRITEARGNYY
ncbi:uncharacterized protein SPAPADRAFT_63769 [Spathaspora passalidarum NRRL Y-27907]|uniref:Uncharacterized protein n=1 Tax=Spathaspora passalidarum (strain NRRL Y-27907 / 11-Y1) TaxID=619300 RepID=G3AVE3_SPAPN|nr:uncharacterized protein SPAPADRAFT_63769 [Spathaspora passalidarum NRRL Y-27907]EGW30162.1 hypothetical protein SPAPADRAFT_63769 [Spathaspora passalidarum NRRL Y-27907]